MLVFFVLSFLASGTYAGLALTDTYSDSVPADGGSFREGIVGIPRFINPLLVISDADRDVTSIVYTGLLRHDGKGNLALSLAEHYEISEDGLSYTFYLHRNARWSDGAPLGADDVIYTISLAKDPQYRSVIRPNWEGVTVEKIDDYTVIFTLAKPYAPFLENATLGILPKHIWREVLPAEFPLSEFNLRPVGAGPYRAVGFEQQPNGRIASYALEANPYYLPAAPHISQIKLMFFTSAAELLEARAGNLIDTASMSAALDVPAGDTVIRLPIARIFGVFFNQNSTEVLADEAVREALQYATDRQRLVTDVLHTNGIPIHTPLPISGTGALSDQAAFHLNVASSTALLERAGWTDEDNDGIREKNINDQTIRLAFTISTTNAPDLAATARLLQEMWKAVGADVQVAIFEIGDFEQNILRQRNYESLLFGEVFGYDPDPFAFWHASQRNDPGLNIALYTNPQADTLLEKARTVTDRTARHAIYEEFQSIVLADNPAVFLYSPEYAYVPVGSIKNINLTQIVVPSDRFGSIHEWYIKTKKQWKGF